MNSNQNRTSSRNFSLAAGILYLLTFISIPTLWLYAPVLSPNYITGAGPDTPAIVGSVLELFMALACIGTAVVLYPVLKHENESLSLGFVAARVLEAATIFADLVAVMAIVTLRKAGVGPEGLITGKALVALHDWFRLGQNFLPAVNALLLGTLLYRSRLVPRVLPVLGLVGAPFLLINSIIMMFGINGILYSITGLIGVIPIALWEFSLGVWLTVKGFNQPALAAVLQRPQENELISTSQA